MTFTSTNVPTIVLNDDIQINNDNSFSMLSIISYDESLNSSKNSSRKSSIDSLHESNRSKSARSVLGWIDI